MTDHAKPSATASPAADVDLRDGSPASDDALAQRLRPVSGRPADLDPRHHLITVTGGDRWLQAEAFVYDIYRDIGYCEESPKKRVEQLARWDDRSRFHAVIDDDEEIIGVVRTIFGPYGALPVGQFTRTDHDDPDPVCELSSLTVSPHMRSTGVIEHLYRAGWLDALLSQANALVALIDPWLFDVFQSSYCLPFRVIGVAENYMGSEPLPVAMPLNGERYQPTADHNPEFWAWTLEALTSADRERWSMPLLEGRWPDDGIPHPLSPRVASSSTAQGREG